MNVSVFYRSTTVWNIILFLLLTFFFLFFQEGLLQARSVFERSFIKEIFFEYLPFMALLLVSAFSVFKLKHKSKLFFLLSALGTVGITVTNLLDDFSKLVVIALFVYVLSAYYFYQFLKIEVNEAYYNPMYNEDDLFSPMLKRIHCEVRDSESGKVLGAILTNWNPNGCFIFLDEQAQEIRFKNIKLKANLNGTDFTAPGMLVAKAADGRGFGFRLLPETSPENSSSMEHRQEEFGWKDFYTIIDQLGYTVELLK